MAARTAACIDALARPASTLGHQACLEHRLPRGPRAGPGACGQPITTLDRYSLDNKPVPPPTTTSGAGDGLLVWRGAHRMQSVCLHTVRLEGCSSPLQRPSAKQPPPPRSSHQRRPTSTSLSCRLRAFCVRALSTLAAIATAFSFCRSTACLHGGHMRPSVSISYSNRKDITARMGIKTWHATTSKTL